MVARILLIASAACVLNLANGSSDPFPGFHPCKMSDDDCVLDNTIKGVPFFADGIPSLDVKRLDPVSFKIVDSSSPNLKFILHDIILTGLKTCKPLEARHDLAKSQLIVVLQCILKLAGRYEMDGKLLTFPITGNGKIDVHLKNIVNKVTLNYFFKEGKDGKKHLRIKNFEHSYELKEKSDVSFEGLVLNSDILNQAVDDLIKNNGNEIVEEIGDKMFKAAIKEIVENINRFTGKIPHDELSLD